MYKIRTRVVMEDVIKMKIVGMLGGTPQGFSGSGCAAVEVGHEVASVSRSLYEILGS